MMLTNTGILMIVYGRLVAAGLGELSDRLIELASAIPGGKPVMDADILRIMTEMRGAFPEHQDTIAAMFTAPLAG